MNTNEIDITLLYPGEPAVKEDKVNSIIFALENNQILDPITIAIIKKKYFVRDGNHRVKALLEYCTMNDMTVPKIRFVLNNDPFPSINAKKDHSDFLLFLGEKYGIGIQGFNNVHIVSEERYDDISCKANQEFENAEK